VPNVSAIVMTVRPYCAGGGHQGENMVFGLEGFTLLHIVISLLAIGSGLVVVGGFLTNSRLDGANLLFLATTVATSATGFLFPFVRFLPSHLFSVISLIVLAVATYAYYAKRLDAPWRRIYVVSALTALYLNVFVLVVQTFVKNPALAAIAPNQSELPFVTTQIFTLLTFLALGYLSIKRFHAR
jgi:hypothetical protein